jgi:cathepsin L
MQKLLIWALFCLVVAEHKSLGFEDSKVPGVDKFQAKVYQDVITEEWELWKVKHDKSYDTAEEDDFRMKVFTENKYRIAKHNVGRHLGHHNYTLEMNNYGDMLPHEFKGLMNGHRSQLLLNSTGGLLGSKVLERPIFIQPANVELPESVDWRTLGAVTPIKDQGRCGSCWAFSTTGALEGQHFRKTGKLVSLSEQNLVDCSRSTGNLGCNGGLPDFAFEYIKKNHGIDTEESYPYEGIDRTCRYNKKNLGATDYGFVDIYPSGDEQALKAAVATVGPIAVGIDASAYSFQFYRGGVYEDHRCSPYNLDHAVLVVGYGTTKEGQDYWLVKNSWSPVWGDEGYIKMLRNKDNSCGIATMASFPQV